MKKKSYNEIKEYIESFNYELLSEEYKNAHDNLLLRCPESHIYKVNWNNFKSGFRCPYCAGNAKLTYNEIKKYIEFAGYKLNSYNYID